MWAILGTQSLADRQRAPQGSSHDQTRENVDSYPLQITSIKLQLGHTPSLYGSFTWSTLSQKIRLCLEFKVMSS